MNLRVTRYIDSSLVNEIEKQLLSVDLHAPIGIYFDSMGGDIGAGKKLYELLLARPNVYGLVKCAGSVALTAFLGCRNRVALPFAYFMFHSTVCKHSFLKEHIDDLNKIVAQTATESRFGSYPESMFAYAEIQDFISTAFGRMFSEMETTNIPNDKLDILKKRNTESVVFGSDAALEWGVIHEIYTGSCGN